MRKSAFTLLLFIILLSNLHAQQIKELSIRKLAKEYGLNENYIADMIQDVRGVYWMSSLNGLIRFDGKETQRFHLPFYKNKILGSNILSTLFFENDSMLWIAHSQGMCKFNVFRQQFYPIAIEKDYPSQTLNFSVIKRDQIGTIWISTRELGLMNYDEKQNKIFKNTSPDFKDVLRVRNILLLDNNFLLFCHARGQFLWNVKTQQAETFSSVPSLNHLSDSFFDGTTADTYMDSRGMYSSVRKKGVPYYEVLNYNYVTQQKIILPIRSDFGFKYFRDSKNNLWIYNDGIYLLEASSGKLYTIRIPKSEIFSQCYTIYEDPGKNIWFCTNDGLYVLEPNRIILENRSEKVNDTYVPHVFTAFTKFNHEFWLATYGEGLVICDSNYQFKKNINLEKLAHENGFNHISMLYTANSGMQTWIGCILGKVACYDLRTEKFTFYQDTLFHQQRINNICEDPSGNTFYFGTNEGRIISFDAKTKRFDLVYNELNDSITRIDFISGLILADKNTLYISTAFNGFYKMSLKTKKIESFKLDPENKNSIKSNDLYSIYSADQKNFYFGSTNGLIHYNSLTSKFSAYTPDDGLPFSEVYNTTLYKNNELLSVTSDGLYSIDFEKKSCTKIGNDSPIESINFSNAYYDSHKNLILLCSDDYFYSLRYENKTSAYIPNSYIYNLKTFDSTFYFSQTLPEVIRLKRNQNSVTFNFGSSGFAYPDKLDYQYKIEELGENWINTGKSRSASFNNLKGGVYNFKIRVTNKENNSIVEELKLTFEIQKAFYETVWFYLLVLISISSLLYVVYRIRVNKLLAIEKVRLKLSRDLHDDIGSTLSTINILSTIAVRKLSSEPKTTANYLEKISTNSQDIMENMGDIVWSINPANDSIQKVISKMREFATTILEPKNISFDLQMKEELNSMELKMEYRRDLFLIYKEAINNAAKYANCTRIRISLTLKNKTLTLKISDNGSGFDLSAAGNGNGLSNMKRRAEAIHGKFSITSDLGEGTTISVEIPTLIIK